MLIKIAKCLNIFLALMMLIDVVGMACKTDTIGNTEALSYHCKHIGTSDSYYMLFQKEAEEESDKSDVERANFVGPELLDLSQITIILSDFHTSAPGVSFAPYDHFALKPLSTLHCVLVI